jgi:Uma2 family endonuclease
VRIPAGITDLASFQRWSNSPEFPRHGWFNWLGNHLEVELEEDDLITPATPPAPPPVAASAVVINGWLHIPKGITDLATFEQWLESDHFPEQGRFSWLDGVLWVDLGMEQLYWHNEVKAEVATVLRLLVRASRSGRYCTDGMRLINPTANLNTDPDGLFYLFTTQQSGKVRQVPGRLGGVVAFEGTPDMVLEVVSDNSVQKDMVTLPPQYQAAGVPEFWRIDARAALQFELLRLTPSGYVATVLDDGWQHSDVFGRDFRLVGGTNPVGEPQFTLEVR